MSRRRRKRSKKPRPPTRIERSAGGLIWRKTPTGVTFLAILDSHNNWALPKGHIEGKETVEAAARREIQEETGLSALALTNELVTTDFWFEDKWERKGERVHKFVSYFLYQLIEPQPVITSIDEHIQEHRWVSAAELPNLLTYASLKPVVAAALGHFDQPSDM